MKKIRNYTKKNINKIILIITTILFISLTFTVLTNRILPIDNNVHSFILKIRNPFLTSTLLITTYLGSSYILIIISILLLVIIKNKKIPICISLNLICSFLINQLAKIIFERPRPLNINLVNEIGFSYPSGHSMVSMAYYGFIIYLTHIYIKNKKIKIYLITILSLIILTIGFSRIYLGVHYLSDVIGGFLLSLSYLMIYIKNIKLEKK